MTDQQPKRGRPATYETETGGASLEEIAAALGGLSHQRTSAILARALAKVKVALAAKGVRKTDDLLPDDIGDCRQGDGSW